MKSDWHGKCSPPERITVHKSPSVCSLPFSRERTSLKTNNITSPLPSQPRKAGSSSRYERPISAGTNTVPSPRFGSRTSCPGCLKSVSPMERGVIPGPQGSRWHVNCLVCGGKQPQNKSNSWMLGRGEEKKKGPGCGKKLDSAAKTDTTGRIWCRECLVSFFGSANDCDSEIVISVNAWSWRPTTDICYAYFRWT